MASNHCRKNPHVGATSVASSHKLSSFIVLLFVLLQVLQYGAIFVRADGDWQNHCGMCHCTWNSGKKQADCKSHSFTVVPTELTTELQVIDLSYNQIAELRSGEFGNAGMTNMHKIYLRNCTIQEVNPDAFSGLEVLIELDLSHNQIRQLRPGTFRGLFRLRTLMLNGNQLDRLDDHLFEELPFLYKLEVRSNRLHHIGMNVFEKTKSVMNIALDQNRLTVLQPETFRKLENLKELSLNENPWNCTCTLQQFQRYVIANKLYTPPTSCVLPPHLRGRLWSELTPENFACRPRIIQPAVDQTVEAASDNLTLTCRINGSPSPQIEWFYQRRPINADDRHTSIRNWQEMNRVEVSDVYTSELTIVDVRVQDRGDYTCTAANLGGKAEVVFRVTVPAYRGGVGGFGGFVGGVIGGSMSNGGHTASNSGSIGTDGLLRQGGTNLLLIVCMVVIVLLVVLIVVIVLLCCYCRRIKKYAKNGSMGESGLMGVGKGGGGGGHDGGKAGAAILAGMEVGGGSCGLAGESMLEGSVIMEMQKSLLTDVNPVEKPPRRVEMDGVVGGSLDVCNMEDAMELKKTLLGDTLYGAQDDETQSVSLSDHTARSRTTYIDDGYGTNLPPDLLAFPSRFAQSPSQQSSISNIPDSSSASHNHSIYMTAGADRMATSQTQGVSAAAASTASNYMYQPQPTQHFQPHHPLLGGEQNSSVGGGMSVYHPVTSSPAANSGYRTLQLPKQRGTHHQNNFAVLSLQQQKQFQPHVLHYQKHHQPSHIHHGTLRSMPQSAFNVTTTPQTSTSIVMKQGYVTIPRKPRTPSWTPSLTSTMTADYPLITSPTPSYIGAIGIGSSLPGTDTSNTVAAEPVYDNLGLRTTASGHSALDLDKIAAAAAAASSSSTLPSPLSSTFPMKDRPLPATPKVQAASETADSFPTQLVFNTEAESLYGSRTIPIGADGTPRTMKIPPRPPPKPKKKTANSASSIPTTIFTSEHLFEDECEDGTEV